MIDNFLIILGIIYLAVASIQDLRKREVWNWLSFSLIIFALAYRAFYAVLNSDILFFVYGLVGFVVFIGLGYLFYYARLFAGGDAKLLMAMGAVLPLSNLYSGLILTGGFVLLLLFAGGVYGLIYSFFMIAGNPRGFAKEFVKQYRKYKILSCASIVAAVVLIIFVFFLGDYVFFLIPGIILLFPLLFAYGKAIENSCMIRSIKTSQLTEGDWLVSSVKVGKKTIRPYWEGLSADELAILRNYRGKVKVRYGIPFVPSFFIAFVILVLLLLKGIIL